MSQNGQPKTSTKRYQDAFFCGTGIYVSPDVEIVRVGVFMGICYLVFLRIDAAPALRQVRCVCDDAIPTSGDLMRVTLHLSGRRGASMYVDYYVLYAFNGSESSVA